MYIELYRRKIPRKWGCLKLFGGFYVFILTIIVVGINTKEEYNFLLNRDFSHIMFQNILYLFLAYTFLFWEIEEWSWRFAYRK
jgi:hypothetical protein